MCGIAVVVGREAVSTAAIDAMIDALAHRGPDDRGHKILSSCTLGHARLEILDLATGAQPLSDSTGRHWISFNGEIYNYRELRDELLKRGHVFRTESDTEVVVAAYREWGVDALNRFRGMFAFAIWDQQERQLFAARDLFGEKPLYYASAPDGTFLVASEIKALLASGKVEGRLDRESIDAYLAFGYVPPNRTIYSDVKTLPPAHFLRWKTDVSVHRYWTPRFEPRAISEGDANDRIRELLEQAVSRELVADVEVGALLSGGIDSSVVVALAAERRGSGPPLRTFSVGFGTTINELPFARLVADRYATDHHEIDVGDPPVAETLQKLTTVYDEPFADSSQIPTYAVARYARQSVKVVLTGDGGDELFGGYTRYAALLEAGRMTVPRLRWLGWRLAGRMLRLNEAALLRRRTVALAAQWDDPWQRAAMSHVAFPAVVRSKLWGAAVSDDHLHDSDVARSLSRGSVDTAVEFDLQSYLPGDILTKVDRAAMAHGLETRAPFLDRDLVEFALTLPLDERVARGTTKVALKRAFEGDLPDAIVSRAKQGFDAPYPEWLGKAEMRPMMQRIFERGSPLLRLLPGAGAYRERRDHGTWNLLILGLWLEARHF